MFDMKLLRIQKIVKCAGFGASAPIIIQSDDKEYAEFNPQVQPHLSGIFKF